MTLKEGQATLSACPRTLSTCQSKPFPLKAMPSMAWSMIHVTLHFIALTMPICLAHYATRMRRQSPSCIQHDSTAHKDGMRNTLGTWQHNCSTPEPRDKTRSVWIKMPYQYQGVVQTRTLQLSMPCTLAATDCPVLHTEKERPSRVPSAPSDIKPLM